MPKTPVGSRGHAKPWHRLLIAVAVAGMLSAAAGCSQKPRWYKHHAFVTQADVVRYLRTALEGDLPDERREAINRIARTRHRGHQVVLEALDAIARTDTSPSVRCAALQALRESGSAQAVVTFVAVLDPETSLEQVRAPSPQVRRDALRGALALLEGGKVALHRRSALLDIAVNLIARDRSRDIRQASARVLGYFQDRRVLEPLVAALDQRDFGVVYEAERSLMRLTGQTCHHDSAQWRQWLAQTDNPFADAGKLEQVLEAGEKGWWQRSMDSVGHSFRSFRPKKEDS